MPTVLREAGLRFHFFSADRNEPPHVHVDGHGRRAKIWIETLRVAKSGGFGDVELKRMVQVVAANQARFLEAWNDFLG